jgi:hypothetical protein
MTKSVAPGQRPEPLSRAAGGTLIRRAAGFAARVCLVEGGVVARRSIDLGTTDPKVARARLREIARALGEAPAGTDHGAAEVPHAPR